MGCGDECPYFPGKRYEDWVLDDPAGQRLDVVRRVRDEIRRRVERLVDELDSRPRLARDRLLRDLLAADLGGGEREADPLLLAEQLGLVASTTASVGSSDWP